MRFCESAPVLVPIGTFSLRIDRLGGIELVHTSQALREILEAQTDTLPELSKHLVACVHPDDRSFFSEALRNATMRLQPAAWEGRLTIGDMIKTVRMDLSPPPTEDLQKTWTGVFQDLTDVKDLQERFESVLDAAQAYTWRRDMQLRQSQFGQRWARFAHHDDGKDSLQNDEWLARVHPEDAPTVQAQVEALERGEVEHQVLLYRRKLADGSWVWLRVHAGISERDEGGAPIALSGVSFDITAEMERRKQSETEKQHLRDELSNVQAELERTAYDITENIPVGTYTMVLGPDDDLARFGFMSRKFLEITGLEEEEARADPLRGFACVHPDDYDDWVQKNAHAFVHKAPFREETRLLVKGQLRWVVAESIPRLKKDGTWIWEGVIQDITSQKVSEQALRRANRDLLQMETAKARLAERELLLQDIHDGFGNQLAIGKLRLRRGEVTPENAIDIIDSCIDDLRLLFESLDAMGESLFSVLLALEERMKLRTRSLPIKVDWNISAAQRIQLPSRLMLQVARIVQEAVANSIRHADTPSISINVEADNDRWLIEVNDNGRGFNVNLPHTGAGLRNMKMRAARSGFQLSVVSDRSGTCVTIAYDQNQR